MVLCYPPIVPIRERPSNRASDVPTPRRPRRRPLRRATDPTLVLGDARPLTVGSALAAIAGSLLAVLDVARPVALVLSSVVAIGLYAGARRFDILARPNLTPDRTARSRRVVVAIWALAVLGTVWSAWNLAEGWSR